MILGAGGLFIFWWRNPVSNPAPTVTPTIAPSDPAALELLEQMEAAMNQLTTLRAVEVLRDDSGNALTTTLEYAAPNLVRLQTDTGAVSIGIGSRQWGRAATEPLFSTWTRPEPFVFPDFHYYSRQALGVQMGTASELEALPVKSVAFTFVEADGRFDFVIYANPTTLLFRRLTMDGPSHHMKTDFVDYAPVVIITPPPSAEIAATATVIP